MQEKDIKKSLTEVEKVWVSNELEQSNLRRKSLASTVAGGKFVAVEIGRPFQAWQTCWFA